MGDRTREPRSHRGGRTSSDFHVERFRCGGERGAVGACDEMGRGGGRFGRSDGRRRGRMGPGNVGLAIDLGGGVASQVCKAPNP